MYLGAYVILELASHWVWNPLIAVRKHLPFNAQLLFSLFSIIIAKLSNFLASSQLSGV